MQLYSAGEIVKKLHGVSTRQILDLAEKGLITPARETTGAGSPRLYDFENIFEICICLALRGKLPAGGATLRIIAEILEYIRDTRAQYEKEMETESAFSYLTTEYGEKVRTRNYGTILEAVYIAYDGDPDDIFLAPISFDKFAPPIQKLLSLSKKYKPQNYCTYLLEVEALRKYLKGIF